MQHTITTGRGLTVYRPTALTAFRKPATVNLMAMEEQLRKGLEGKFFDIYGLDLRQDEEEHAKEVRRQLFAEHKRKAGEKLRHRCEARRIARESLLKDRKVNTTFTPAIVIEAVCHAHDVTIDELLSDSRCRKIICARQHACWLTRKISGKSSTHIGVVIGRDHSTVIHACIQWEIHRVKFQRETDIVNEVLGLKT